MKSSSRGKWRWLSLAAAGLLAAVPLGLTGCSQAKKASPSVPAASAASAASPAEPVVLTVFAAASLTEALSEIAEKYKTEVPEVTLTFNFDSSGKLQTQIENGAETDLFLSAAQKQMDALESGEYLLDGTRANLLVNKVVMIVPRGSGKGITSFEDAAADKVGLIALGNSDVPVGQYSEEIYTYLKLWNAVKAKASFGGNVKEVLSQVSAGSVDCGVVYATDAATADGVEVVAEAPADSHFPVVYPAAVLKKSAEAEAAKAFLAYLNQSDAARVFKSVGFSMAS